MTHESMLRAYSELEDQIAKLFTTDIETEQLVLKIYSKDKNISMKIEKSIKWN